MSSLIDIMLPYDEYVKIIQNEYNTAQYFHDSNIDKFKSSKKYIYKWSIDMYNGTNLLWVQVDKGQVVEYMCGFFKVIFNLYIDHDKTLSDEKKATLEKLTNKLNKNQTMKNIFELYEPKIMDDNFYDNLNRYKIDHLPIKDGKVINLTNGCIRDREKTDYFTYESNVTYTDKRSPDFITNIRSIMCDNEDNMKYLQKILGYCLTAEMKARVYFIFYGIGANGKSMILNLMNKILLNQYQSVSKCVFIDAGKGKSGGCEALQLKDCRLATFSETDADDKLNESLIKMITGGDPITARGLFKDPVTFKPTSKVILCTNNKPEFNGNDKATVDRVRFIPFSARFVDNPSKKNEYKRIEAMDKIIESKYMDEFFSWCVDGAIEYYKNGEFTPTGDILKEQMDYVKEQSSITNFIDETYDYVETELVLKSDIKQSYEHWCKENSMKQMKPTTLFTKIDELYGKSFKSGAKETKNKWVYKGLKLKSDEPVSDLDQGL